MKILEFIFYIIKWILLIATIMFISLLLLFFVSIWFSEGVQRAFEIFQSMFEMLF